MSTCAGLAIEYRSRRDFFIDTIAEEFHTKQSTSFNPTWAGMDVHECSLKPQGMLEKASYKKMFSFVPPTSGMFIWVCVFMNKQVCILTALQIAMHFDSHPSFKEGDEETLEVQLFTKFAEAGILLAPGWYFASTDDINDAGQGHYRISFSNADVCLDLFYSTIDT